MAFGFDYCYWSVNPEDPQYASQDVVISFIIFLSLSSVLFLCIMFKMFIIKILLKVIIAQLYRLEVL